jgi:FkbM family methyltransferase
MDKASASAPSPLSSVRTVLRPLLRALWPLTWPVRAYWLRSERKVGKKLVLDRVLKPLLPGPPRGFEAELPGGGRIFLHYREDIGLVTLLGGGFERAELERARALARAGTTAIDVGANVGVYAIVLARAVGAAGRVLAFEPGPENARRLEENLARNALENVDLHRIAVADRAGELLLRLGADPAYHSTGDVFEGRASGAELRVPARTLDEVWREAGSPEVSFAKLDTEGGELDVLRGATELLARDRPPLLVEARDARVADWLAERGYEGTRPHGFALGNVLFVPVQ